MYSPLDWSQALLLAMAVGTLVGGSLWAATDERDAADKQRKAPDSAVGGGSTGDATEPPAPAALRQVPWLLRYSVDACNQGNRCSARPAAVRRGCSQPANSCLSHVLYCLQQDSISPRLRRSTSEERGGGGAVAAPPNHTAPDAPSNSVANDDVMYVTAWGAVAYLFIASAVLVALFFMLDYINALIVRTSDQPLLHQPAALLALQLSCVLRACQPVQHLHTRHRTRRWRCSASAPSRP